MELKSGIFVISLDFELAWGFHDGKRAQGTYRESILGARTVIPKLLELFAKYDIHVTWAIVGALRCRSKSELTTLMNGWVGARKNKHGILKYIEQNVGENEEDDPLHYASSLIDLIKEYPNQYIGSHTFSHPFLYDKTLNPEDFDTDLAAFKTVFPDACTNVFARNQIPHWALETLSKHGFKGYRGIARNDRILNLYKERVKTSFVMRTLRFLDSYWPLTGYYDYSLVDIKSGHLLNIPASAFLRPYCPLLKNFEPCKLNRIKKSMKHATLKRRVYHLYWHPHNVGINQEKNIMLIEKILQYYLELKQKHQMRNLSMEEVCEAYGGDFKNFTCD